MLCQQGCGHNGARRARRTYVEDGLSIPRKDSGRAIQSFSQDTLCCSTNLPGFLASIVSVVVWVSLDEYPGRVEAQY